MPAPKPPLKKDPAQGQGVRLYQHRGKKYYKLGRSAEHGRAVLADELKVSIMDIQILDGGEIK